MQQVAFKIAAPQRTLNTTAWVGPSARARPVIIAAEGGSGQVMQGGARAYSTDLWASWCMSGCLKKRSPKARETAMRSQTLPSSTQPPAPSTLDTSLLTASDLPETLQAAGTLRHAPVSATDSPAGMGLLRKLTERCLPVPQQKPSFLEVYMVHMQAGPLTISAKFHLG